MNAKPKTRAQIQEDREIAAQIAKAHEFSASIRLGPADKRTRRGFKTYDQAREAAVELDAESKFGRRAVIYAINSLGSFPCDPDLIAMARQINPAI